MTFLFVFAILLITRLVARFVYSISQWVFSSWSTSCKREWKGFIGEANDSQGRRGDYYYPHAPLTKTEFLNWRVKLIISHIKAYINSAHTNFNLRCMLKGIHRFLKVIFVPKRWFGFLFHQINSVGPSQNISSAVFCGFLVTRLLIIKNILTCDIDCPLKMQYSGKI